MAAVIERATPYDYGAIAELNLEAYREFATHVTAKAWQAMQMNLRNVQSTARRAAFLVARVSDEIAGSVAYCPARNSDPAIFPPDWPSILLLAVLPRHRGHGVATGLLRACVDLAREDRASTVGLFTSELMAPARRLYENMGFEQDGEIPHRHGIRYWRYRLDLTDQPGVDNG